MGTLSRMQVSIKLHDDLRKATGTDVIRVRITEDETVDTLLMKLSKRHPRLLEEILDPVTGEPKPNVLLNGRRIQELQGIHTKLKHKDEIAILPS